ncbi:basal body-orientation factor 1 [Hyperolius riggenbachi]|uniref:basal body-orientation factor 1 n=1 Tax=Hyperolius riggenbachi TaxID=752182 RepID=UPI0035A36278
MPGVRKGSKRKKKVGKHDTRVEKESEVEKMKANAAVWESRLKMAELSRSQYRDAARTLAQNNEELSKNQEQMEKDLLDVVGFLKKQDQEKDELIEKLQQQLYIERKQAEEERDQLVDTYKKQMDSLEARCAQKSHDLQMIQSEFRAMKEFRRRKMELERELDEMKERLHQANLQHKEAVAANERRFFQEKQRLEKEAEKKVVLLAEKAHSEAIIQLDEVGRSVFRENVRLKEALSYHVDETRNLQKSIRQLKDEKERLLQDKESYEKLVEEKVLQVAQKNSQIQEIQRTLQRLEHASPEDSLQKKQLPIDAADQAGRLEKLQKLLDMKEREMNRVKKLAHNILQERTEVELFFLQSLEHVRQEIQSSRNCYQKLAQAAYNSRMMEAATGTENYPKVRTFQNKEHSTNDVIHDLREAEKWSHMESGKVDFGDLTWEQKEKVLRLLFAKMNGAVKWKKTAGVRAVTAPAASELPSRECGQIGVSENTVFITQQVPEQSPSSAFLPDIHMAKLHNVA